MTVDLMLLQDRLNVLADLGRQARAAAERGDLAAASYCLGSIHGLADAVPALCLLQQQLIVREAERRAQASEPGPGG